MNNKVLLFDLYGLFMQEQDDSGRASIEKAAQLEKIGISREDFWHAYHACRSELDAGRVSYSEYFQLVAGKLGIEFPHLQAVVDADYESYQGYHADMVAWLREIVDQGWHPALLSNLVESLKYDLLARYDWLHLFDPAVFSCDVDLAKPNVEIYELAIEKINEARAARNEAAVQACDILFFDDREVNCAGARAAGMHAHLFIGLADAQAAAAQFLVG